MPIGLQVHLSGSVSTPHMWGTVTGRVDSISPTVNSIAGTVARDVVDAYDQPRGTGTFYYRVRLGDEWIPEAELAGALTIDRDLDAHTVTFEFGLAGRRWSIFATERTWSRTRVEVHRWRGQSASEMLPDESLVGYVRTCQQSHEPEPVVRVRCANAGVLFERATVCLEIPPFSGLTRGQILAQALTSAGLNDFDVPPGAVYDKGLQAIDAPLFEWIQAFIEPEGWAIRWRGETLEIYRPEMQRAPLPPHALWTANDWLSSSAAPPSSAPSVWVLRGTGAVVVDELGYEVTVTETEIVAPYSPKQAVARQVPGTTEVIQPLSFTSLPVQDRVISRIVDQRVTRGGRLIQQLTDEYGYGNPGAAKLRTLPSSDSYLYLDVYIDEDGRFVRWLREKFHHLTRLRTTPVYDDDGNLLETRVESHGYHLRTMGVRNHAADPSTVTVSNAYIHGDDQSYSERYEPWGRFEEQRVGYAYDEATGARSQEIQDTYRYYAPRCRLDGPAVLNWYVLYKNEGQTELIAQWRRVESKIRSQILAEGDATVLGDIETRFGFGSTPQKHDGAFDWGSFRSNADEEGFSFLDRKTVRYDVVNDDQVDVEIREPGKTPERRTLLGGRPLPAFLASPWTRLSQEPLEILVEDPTAEQWFGAEVRVLQSEHVLSTAEGLAVVERSRHRALAPGVEITRPVTFADVGDTVELVDPPSGAFARGLVVSVRETWDMARAEFTAVYRLEVDR